MDEAAKIVALRAVPLFSEVGLRDLKRIAESAVERHFEAGHEIVGEGERGVAMFIMVKGSVAATKKSGDGPVKVAELGPGSFFGELALFEDFRRNATVTAVTPVDCLAITEWDFKAELRTEPLMMLQMLKTTFRRLRETTARLAELEESVSQETVD